MGERDECGWPPPLGGFSLILDRGNVGKKVDAWSNGGRSGRGICTIIHDVWARAEKKVHSRDERGSNCVKVATEDSFLLGMTQYDGDSDSDFCLYDYWRTEFSRRDFWQTSLKGDFSNWVCHG